MRHLIITTALATLITGPALAQDGYRHAEEEIGTVEQIYDGDLLPDLAVSTFRNIDRLFPTRTVPASDNPHVLDPAETPLGPVTATVDEKTWDMDDFVALDSVTGLIVLKDGKVAYEIYQRGNGPDTRWMSMSLAKSVTSTLIGAAIKDGSISGMDALVTDYVPALKGSAYEGVTVEQILQMSSGVQWDETYTDPDSDRSDLLAAQIAQEPGGLMQVMAALPQAAEPVGPQLLDRRDLGCQRDRHRRDRKEAGGLSGREDLAALRHGGRCGMVAGRRGWQLDRRQRLVRHAARFRPFRPVHP